MRSVCKCSFELLIHFKNWILFISEINLFSSMEEEEKGEEGCLVKEAEKRIITSSFTATLFLLRSCWSLRPEDDHLDCKNCKLHQSCIRRWILSQTKDFSLQGSILKNQEVSLWQEQRNKKSIECEIPCIYWIDLLQLINCKNNNIQPTSSIEEKKKICFCNLELNGIEWGRKIFISHMNLTLNFSAIIE